MTEALEARLAKLEAIEDVKAFKMRYAKLCDAGYPAKEISAMFVETASWDGGDYLGVHQGPAAIEEFFVGTGARIPFALHYTVAGDVKVSDDATTASATWYLWQPMIIDGIPCTMMATYEDDYVLTDDGWRYANLKITTHALTPTSSDWLATRLMDI